MSGKSTKYTYSPDQQCLKGMFFVYQRDRTNKTYGSSIAQEPPYHRENAGTLGMEGP